MAYTPPAWAQSQQQQLHGANPYTTVQGGQNATAQAQGLPTTTPAQPQPGQMGPTLGQNTGPLGQWNSWMTSGGVNPQQWQSLGGQPNTNFLNWSNWSQGNSDPTQVTPTDPQTGFQSYIDNAYDQQTRQLDPQWQQAQQQFDQSMVNRGLAPGSAAYDSALADFNRSREDAYSNARSTAQQQGLAAQNQAFGQGLAQSQLSSALANALIGANTSYANQQLGGNASLMGQLLGGNQGIAQQLIGADASMFNANVSAGASRYGADLAHQLGMANLTQSGQQQDWDHLMQLIGMGQGVTGYNNGLLTQDQNRNQSFFGYLPGGSTGNIDVQNPYNNAYNGQLNSWNAQNQQANAQNQQWAQYASMIAALYGGG